MFINKLGKEIRLNIITTMYTINSIFHVLSMTGIVPAINPTLDQMINEKIKEAMRGE